MIYLIEAVGTGMCKIGHTANAASRLTALQIGCPFALKLVSTREGGKRLEDLIHSKISEFHVRGEWFHCSAAVMKAFEETECPEDEVTQRYFETIDLGQLKQRAAAVRVPISKLCLHAGIAYSTFNRWEKGTTPHPVTVGKLEDALVAAEKERAA